ncbi:E3 ubiquitin-protein ligase sh3rf3 [Balamuthia mandrillaris]
MGFADDLWDDFEAVATKATEGKRFAKEVETFVKKRAEIERDYAKKLSSLLRSTKATDAGTLAQAWVSMQAETENISKAHQDLGDRLQTEVADTIKQWITDSEQQRKSLKAQGKKLEGELQRAQVGVEKAKLKFEASRKKQDALSAEAKSDASSKMQKKLTAETKMAEKADIEYKQSVEKLQQLETKFYDTEMPQILRDLEAIEHKRLDVLKHTLANSVAADSIVHPLVKVCCERMESSVQAIDPNADVASFIASHKTNKPKPPRCQYQPYDSALGACKPADDSGSGGSTSSGPSIISLGASSSSGPKFAGGSSVAFPSASSAPSSGNSSPAASFRGASSTPAPARSQLSSVIASLPPSRPPPSAKPSASAASAPATTTNDTDTSGTTVKALYKYVATEETELSFEPGEIIHVTYQDDSGWWEGELNGRVGVFPSNHVEVVAGGSGPVGGGQAAAAEETYDEGTFDQCRALFAYNAEEEGELTIQPGDIITVEDEDDEGWYYGTNQKGEYGKYPSNYVEILQASAY